MGDRKGWTVGIGRRLFALTVCLGLGTLGVTAVSEVAGAAGVASAATGPSAFCHLTDGLFTICGDGSAEWSDVEPAGFPERHAFLYADQADLWPDRGVPGSPVDTFMLMYDECGRTAPLRPDDYFLVSFDTVEQEDGGPEEVGTEELERYNVRIFSDGTIIFEENGEVQTDEQGRARVTEIDGQRGRAGFGRSPRCAFDHLVVEYEIELAAAGGHSYSPDPQFWGGTPPNVPPVAGDDEKDVADRPRDTVAVLGNDTDPDGSIDPATVRIVTQPEHGTAQVDGSGVVTYEKDEDFEDTDSFSYTVQDDDGATSNVAEATITGNCQPGQPIPVTLPAVNPGGTLLPLLKPYRVHYPPVPLTFTTLPARSPAYCSLDSGSGTLNVQVSCQNTPAFTCPFIFTSGIPVTVATSTATAALDFYRASSAAVPPVCDFDALSNNCLLNSPGGSVYVKWSTPGFVIRDAFLGVELNNTGPLSFWVNMNAIVSPRAPLAVKVQQVEAFIHTTMVNHLAAITRIGIVQDPPAEIMVTDPAGRRTGRTDSGDVLSEIPGSAYSTSDNASLAIILEPAAGDYGVRVHGTAGESFDLSMAVIDLFGDVRNPLVQEQRVAGVISPGGNEFTFTVPDGHRPPLPRHAVRDGFDATAMPGNDDGSTAAIPLGFTANFFGRQFTSAFVNNNGNLTFDAPLSTFTPFDLSQTERSIVAPFFADVDTRTGNVTRYGAGTVDGRPAFGITWPGVGCFSNITSVRNTFQVILIDRGDLGPGDFDIEFNYDRIQWETGTASGGDGSCLGGSAARAGFAKGTGEPGTFFELPGSGVNGAFLDINPESGLIHHSHGSPVAGRYLFAVRNGSPQTSDHDADGVRDELDNCPHTANPDQLDAAMNGLGDACEPAGRRHATAGFLQARLDGQTEVEPGPLGVHDEPGILERLVRIVRFRVAAGLTGSAEELTTNLVGSLVRIGLVAAPDAAALVDEVLRQVGSPPDCAAASVDAATLWPPDHRLVPVSVSGISDPDPGDTVTTTIDAVWQDEPVPGPGNASAPDAVLSDPPSASASLRAERLGTGDGRVYRLHVTARDAAGHTCQTVVTVAVPHDQDHPAVDSAPPAYDSLPQR